MMNFQQNVFTNQVQQTDKVQQKRMELLGKMEGQLSKLDSGNVGNGKSSFTAPYKKNPIAYPASVTKTGSIIIDDITDPQIKELYKEYLKTKTSAYKNIEEFDNS
jgi:hypothetical protein